MELLDTEVAADGFEIGNVGLDREYCEEEWQVVRYMLVGDPSQVARMDDPRK